MSHLKRTLVVLIIMTGTVLGTASIASAGTPSSCKAMAQELGSKHGIKPLTGPRPQKTSDHNRGMAWDFMTKGKNGNALAAEARKRKDVKYVLWQVPDHYDHVHVSCK